MREPFGRFPEGVAVGVNLPHDQGSQFLSDDTQREIRCLGLMSSPAFVSEPGGNGRVEPSFRTLKEKLLWVRHFEIL